MPPTPDPRPRDRLTIQTKTQTQIVSRSNSQRISPPSVKVQALDRQAGQFGCLFRLPGWLIWLSGSTAWLADLSG